MPLTPRAVVLRLAFWWWPRKRGCLSQPEKKKKKKRKKDPKAPKHPMSAYIFFTSDHRAAVKAEMDENRAADAPKTKVTDVAKALGKKWNTLDEPARAPYKVKADADKLRYATEMLDYVPDPTWDSGKKKKAKKDPNAPKKPLTCVSHVCVRVYICARVCTHLSAARGQQPIVSGFFSLARLIVLTL